MFKSNVRATDSQKQSLCRMLDTTLATTLDLSLQVKQAHWNIKGAQFFARHELFDKLADRTRAFSDDVAERVSTLGGYARGTARMVAEGSVLPEYDLDAIDGKQHIFALIDRYGKTCALVREQIGQVQKLEEPATEDLLTGVLRELELDMWFLESHVNVEARS
jgi:starvation-inducible DNA-binding protein